ncbi:MAG: hypothetical protein ACRD3O_23165, partial [Terriglobia bacterium]
SPASPGTKMIEVKAHAFYVRSAVLSAFYFVEAYLNGLAFNFTLHCRPDLSQDKQDKLLESDSKTGRERWLSLRSKMLEYPKIILDRRDPPLMEQNCQEMKLLIEEAKELRDSIVHQSPRPEVGSDDFGKLKQFSSIQLAHATRIVDATVSYVMKLNQLLGRHGINLSWLKERGADGKFPQEAFE